MAMCIRLYTKIAKNIQSAVGFRAGVCIYTYPLIAVGAGLRGLVGLRSEIFGNQG